jgi:hypothetical protein
MKLDSRRSKIIFGLFIFFFIGNLIYSTQYILEAFSRSSFLSKLTVDGRNIFIENTYYKGKSSYEYSLWIKRVLPNGQLFNIYDEDSYLYYHSRLNYYLYPQYIPINENIELLANYGRFEFLGRLPYGNVVLAINPKKLRTGSSGGINYVYLKNKRYFLVAKAGNDALLLMRDSFIKEEVLKEPSKWSALYREFKGTYPGKNINMLRNL